jgi:hypothetical protein
MTSSSENPGDDVPNIYIYIYMYETSSKTGSMNTYVPIMQCLIWEPQISSSHHQNPDPTNKAAFKARGIRGIRCVGETPQKKIRVGAWY